MQAVAFLFFLFFFLPSMHLKEDKENTFVFSTWLFKQEIIIICFPFFFLLFWNENCSFWHHWQFCIMPHILSCGRSCCRLAALLLLKCHHSKLTVWVREFTAHVVVIHIDTLCKIWNYAVSIGKQARTPLYLNALHLKTKQHKTKMQHKLKHLRRLSQVYTLKTSAQRLKCMHVPHWTICSNTLWTNRVILVWFINKRCVCVSISKTKVVLCRTFYKLKKPRWLLGPCFWMRRWL